MTLTKIPVIQRPSDCLPNLQKRMGQVDAGGQDWIVALPFNESIKTNTGWLEIATIVGTYRGHMPDLLTVADSFVINYNGHDWDCLHPRAVAFDQGGLNFALPKIEVWLIYSMVEQLSEQMQTMSYKPPSRPPAERTEGMGTR
jgi:hypothetical protein